MTKNGNMSIFYIVYNAWLYSGLPLNNLRNLNENDGDTKGAFEC